MMNRIQTARLALSNLSGRRKAAVVIVLLLIGGGIADPTFLDNADVTITTSDADTLDEFESIEAMLSEFETDGTDVTRDSLESPSGLTVETVSASSSAGSNEIDVRPAYEVAGTVESTHDSSTAVNGEHAVRTGHNQSDNDSMHSVTIPVDTRPPAVGAASGREPRIRLTGSILRTP